MTNRSWNKGEWAELYTVLYLLLNNNLELVNHRLKPLNNDIFQVEKIQKNTNSKEQIFYYSYNEDVIKQIGKNKSNNTSFKKEQIYEIKKFLFEKLTENKKNGQGAFEIPELQDFLNSFYGKGSFKSSSKNKEDLYLINLDRHLNREVKLSYSIKSSIGKASSILNPSKGTTFKYTIKNFDRKLFTKFNKTAKSKIITEKLDFLRNNGCDVIFDSLIKESFKYNLEMVDSNLPKYLANALLYSYEHNTNLEDSFYKSNDFPTKTFSNKKLGDFLLASNFDFTSSKKWNGEHNITGGLLLVQKNGKIICIDMIYYLEELKKFLIKNSKFEKPSSGKFSVFDIVNEDNNFYLLITMQVRFTS